MSFTSWNQVYNCPLSVRHAGTELAPLSPMHHLLYLTVFTLMLGGCLNIKQNALPVGTSDSGEMDTLPNVKESPNELETDGGAEGFGGGGDPWPRLAIAHQGIYEANQLLFSDELVEDLIGSPCEYNTQRDYCRFIERVGGDLNQQVRNYLLSARNALLPFMFQNPNQAQLKSFIEVTDDPLTYLGRLVLALVIHPEGESPRIRFNSQKVISASIDYTQMIQFHELGHIVTAEGRDGPIRDEDEFQGVTLQWSGSDFLDFAGACMTGLVETHRYIPTHGSIEASIRKESQSECTSSLVKEMENELRDILKRKEDILRQKCADTQRRLSLFNKTLEGCTEKETSPWIKAKASFTCVPFQ